jgi:hypothetical protein
MGLLWAAFLVVVACVFAGVHETMDLKKHPKIGRDSDDSE